MPGHQPKTREFAVIFVLAAVAGAISQLVGTTIEVGRTAGWWP